MFRVSVLTKLKLDWYQLKYKIMLLTFKAQSIFIHLKSD